MRKHYIWSVLIIAAFFVLTCPAVHAKEIEIISPVDGDIINITNNTILKWWNNYKKYSSAVNKKVKELSIPDPAVLRWKSDHGPCRVMVSVYPDFKRCETYSSCDGKLKLYNLFRNQTYYWKVVNEAGDTSATHSFKTADIARIIRVPGVTNMRDLGGYKTRSGKYVRQGLLYRGGELDHITKQGETILVNELKIRTELDLRHGEGSAGRGTTRIPRYIHAKGTTYLKILNRKDRKHRLIRNVKILARPGNYPVYFHCVHGRDRTGTLAFVINGLLGVSKKDLYRDYELTYMTKSGSSKAKARARDFNKLYNQMKAYKSKKKSLSYNIEAYLLENGVSKKEIRSIKKILL